MLQHWLQWSPITMSNQLLSVPFRNAHSGNVYDKTPLGQSTYLSTQYTLRACSRDYRLETGKYIESPNPPELDGCKQVGKIAPLTSFDTLYGHCFEGKTKVFEPCHHDTFMEWLSTLTGFIGDTVKKSRLWDLEGVRTISVDEISDPNNVYPTQFIHAINTQIKCKWNPIALFNVQAYIESAEKRGKSGFIFKLPSQSTLMTGPNGGFNNNMTVEMGFEEPEGTYDMEKRTYTKEMEKFICGLHTSHSEDAGKSRRVANFSRIRVLSKSALWIALYSDNNKPTDYGNWIVYCMGQTFNTDLAGVALLVDNMRRELIKYYQSQFDYPNTYNMPVPPTYFICYSEKCLLICISPGVLLRGTPDKMMIDSAMYQYQGVNPISKICKFPEHGYESHKYNYSGFTLLYPYLEYDAQPRITFASHQTVQAKAFPWAPATAKVTPCYASNPLVSTKFGRAMLEDQQSNPDAIWDLVPGTDMIVCFMNHPLNFEDAMMVSSRFADLGGFSSLSVCTYRVPINDITPEIGEQLCRKKYNWWKMPCTPYCICYGNKKGSKYKSISTSTPGSRIVSTSRSPTGVVLEKKIDNGEYQIRVSSFAQALNGDKLSSAHGQKGVMVLTDPEDLPLIVLKDGSSMTADLYMAVGSIVSRQTVGQVYEAWAGWRAAKDGLVNMTAEFDEKAIEPCKYIINPRTGGPIVHKNKDGTLEASKASIGIARFFDQTQMTRERQHLTHSSEGKYSLGTKPGRASGGGVAAAEMDFHAMYGTGNLHIAQELYNRGNVVRIGICLKCKHIEPLCDCGDEPGKRVYTRLSWDVAVFDMISAAANGSAGTYEVSHV
jgi:hypothetical protein